ncbi:MAG TPA: glycoside hydrolase family 3 N-terminal domain-containing protein [Bryobacteraceae bacterium]|nr:glycoside hydrolase family 3 N-terminal domain-containing protein [Bryobacteraceae bacterium]
MSIRKPICTVLFLLSCSVTAIWAQEPSGQTPPYKQTNLPVEERIHDLLGRMTVAEKARQLDMYAGIPDLVDKATNRTHAAPDAVFRTDRAEQLWGNLGVGSIHDLYPPNATLSNGIQRWVMDHSRLGIPALFIEEGLHGYMGFNETLFPAPINLAATWNPELAKETSAAIASEMRAVGVDMVLGPVLDVARDPRWGRVEEDFGEDPYLSGRMGLAYVEGAQGSSLATDHTVVAEPKHFAAYGVPESGTNTSPAHAGERELRTILLKSFEPAIRNGQAMGVMAAYNEIDGIPCTANPLLLLDILRKEWGFRGFVLSDLGAIRELVDKHRVSANAKAAIALALNSGVDMQFYDFKHDVFQDAIVSGIKDGTLAPEALDRAVSSVLRVKFELGLFDHPAIDPDLDAKVRRSPAHLALSLESARQSMCLLKNDGHLLPLSKTLQHIAVIGPNADVARLGDYSDAAQGKHVTMLDGIRALAPHAQIAFNDGAAIPAAVATASRADVVILGLGEKQGISGEGFDRSNLNLPGNQEQLLEAIAATGKPVVLVLQNGRPLTITWAAKHIPAILEAWYPGEFGGRAIAETLFGDNNPAGRITITFPQTVGQLPDFYNYHPSKVLKYIDSNGKPLFPFGYGLSYSTFKYDRISAIAPPAGSKADITVSVDVTNTGALAGDEVAQLYIRDDVSSVETPIKALKGFLRVHLKAGETRTVTFHVAQNQLAVWNTKRQWAIEPGEYTVMVGGSSVDIAQQTKFRLN